MINLNEYVKKHLKDSKVSHRNGGTWVSYKGYSFLLPSIEHEVGELFAKKVVSQTREKAREMDEIANSVNFMDFGGSGTGKR